jgi:hypothetical protein
MADKHNFVAHKLNNKPVQPYENLMFIMSQAICLENPWPTAAWDIYTRLMMTVDSACDSAHWSTRIEMNRSTVPPTIYNATLFVGSCRHRRYQAGAAAYYIIIRFVRCLDLTSLQLCLHFLKCLLMTTTCWSRLMFDDRMRSCQHSFSFSRKITFAPK